MNRFEFTRPDQGTDVAGSTTVVASMRYLGLGTHVGLNYDGASNLNLTYQNGSTGTAGDKYTGLDRFGRIVETIWIKGTGDVVQGVYGRNRSSGIDWRRDDEASSTIAMDALYSYYGLQQVTSWKRGNLSPSGGPPYTGVTSQKQGEDFTYDQTGNWLGDVSDNPNFTQSRTHDVKNQIASITGPTGVIQPDYDNAGNMTLAPSPADWTAGYTYKWDAWNRLVEIKQGGTVIGSYAYDALTRRTRKTVGGVTRDIYYDRQWRSVEERDTSTGTVKVQHAWSPLDRWTLIRRKRNASGSTLNETLFCLRDYLDPVALANTSGAVVERYSYDAFGTVRIMNAAFGVIGNSAYEWEFLYHGEFRDKESELYNYGYRYLDTQLGRWLSRDPLGLRGGLNLYAFVSNLASSKIDVVGLRPGDEVTNCKKTGGWRLDQRIVEPNFLLKRNGVSVSRFYFVCSCEELCCVWNKYSGVEGKRKFWVKVWEDDEEMYFRYEDQEILADQISKIAQSIDNTNANRDSPISIPDTVRDTIHNPPTSPGDLEGRQKELDEHFRKRDEWRKQHNEKWQKMKDQCKASCGRDKNGWDETTYAIFAEVIVGNQVVERNPFTGNRDGTARDLTPNEMDENSKVKRR